MSFDKIKPLSSTVDKTSVEPVIYLTNAGWVARQPSQDSVTGKDYAEVLIAFSPKMGTITSGAGGTQQVYQTLSVDTELTAPADAATIEANDIVSINLTFDVDGTDTVVTATGLQFGDQLATPAGTRFPSSAAEVQVAIITAVNAASTAGEINVAAETQINEFGLSIIKFGFSANAFDNTATPTFNNLKGISLSYADLLTSVTREVIGTSFPTMTLSGDVSELLQEDYNDSSPYNGFTIESTGNKLSIGLWQNTSTHIEHPLTRETLNPDQINRFPAPYGSHIWAPAIGPVPAGNANGSTDGVTLNTFSFKCTYNEIDRMEGSTTFGNIINTTELEIRINGGRLLSGIDDSTGRPLWLTSKTGSFEGYLVNDWRGDNSTTTQTPAYELYASLNELDAFNKADIINFADVTSIEFYKDGVLDTDYGTTGVYNSTDFTDSSDFVSQIQVILDDRDENLKNQFNTIGYFNNIETSGALTSTGRFDMVWNMDATWERVDTYLNPYTVDENGNIIPSNLPTGTTTYGPWEATTPTIIDGVTEQVVSNDPTVAIIPESADGLTDLVQFTARTETQTLPSGENANLANSKWIKPV